jgi:hypothetical protein
VLDLKKKAKGAGSIGVAGTQLALQDDGGPAGSGSSAFSAASTLQVVQSLRVKQASRFDFSASFSKASPPSVPEPSVGVLLGTGLAGLGWFGRRRA